ncbi:MAG: hypothetical protein R3B82_14375 [Sandaracinaceae bacterium]
MPPADLDAMLGEVEKKMEAADRSWTFWLRSRATWLRRLLAFAAAAAVVGVGGVLTLRANFGELPLAWSATAVTSLAVLLGASLYLALRPLHEPPLMAWKRSALIGTSLVATLALALLAPADAIADDRGLLAHVTPCLVYGLLTGLPVFLLLRLLDRGRSTVAILAACAGGLTGNLVLSLHCPRNDAEHLMGAHFGVVLLFLGGLGAIHWLVGRLRDR